MSNLNLYHIATINMNTQKENNLFTGIRHVKILADFIKEYDLHSVGTQELAYHDQNTLQDCLGTTYHISGDFRFRNGPILEKRANAIITKIQTIGGIFTSGTSTLPSFPTKRDFMKNIRTIGIETFAKMMQKRIVTYTINENSKLLHINIHLQDAFSEKRAIQELYLFECIFGVMATYPDYEVILTGGFNDTIDQKSFQDFLYLMQELGFHRVPIEEKMNAKQSESVAVDHIFLSRGLSLEDYKVCQTGDIIETTDHYPIIAKIYRKL